jgi:hypothetical protein
MADISLITYMSCIMSRLAYLNNNNFLDKYTQIMNIKELSSQLSDIKNVDATKIFSPKIKNILKISKQMNDINYKKHGPNKNVSLVESKDIKYFIISNSNYSSVYLIADKRTNAIFIAFRGTSSPKSGMSYSKITSVLPFNTCDTNKTNNGYLLGVFKIVGEIFYTITECIHFLSNDFLKTKNIKLITTGHSLGGGMAQIFSYLWIKLHALNTICCVTFGGPRVMNGSLITKYIDLINKHKIQFARIVTDGDPFPKLPPNTKGTNPNNTYYHVDDMDPTLEKVALFCSNYKKTKKLICNVKNKTKRAKIHMYNHGSYLSINYAKASQGLTDYKKEIKRNNRLKTICRIIIGGNNEPCRVSFFNLQEIKTHNKSAIKNLTMKLSKIMFTDYKHNDIYMNKQILNELIKQSTVMSEDDLNPLKTDTYVNITEYINIKKPNKSLICI